MPESRLLSSKIQATNDINFFFDEEDNIGYSFFFLSLLFKYWGLD